MLIWVASYPRSGNTLTLLVLRNVFGIGNLVALGGDELRAGMPAIKLPSGREVKEAELPDVSLPKQLRWMRDSDETYFVKTHRVRDANSPDRALHCVRDGRDSLVSHAHYTGEGVSPRYDGMGFEDRLEYLMQRKRDGPPMGTWGSHTKRWTERSAPTARIRFEDLISNPIRVVRRACREIDYRLPRASGSLPDFELLREGDEVIFRRGQVGSYRDEMPPEIERRFWRAHGAQMRALGYARDDSGAAAGRSVTG